MKIYVCVKSVPDTAAQINVRDRDQFDESVFFIINPYDENAVEEALKTKECVDDCEVIAVSLGKDVALKSIEAALAMGVDRAIFIKTETHQDSIATAKALAAAITRDGDPELIFTGRESIDSEGMQTMFRLGANLEMPVVTNVVHFGLTAGRVTVERETEMGGREIIEMRPPCVIGAGKGLNKPRYPKLQDIMQAKRKEIKQVDLVELNLPTLSSRIEVLALEPFAQQRRHKILNGSPEQTVKQLVRLLKEEAKIF